MNEEQTNVSAVKWIGGMDGSWIWVAEGADKEKVWGDDDSVGLDRIE